MAGPVSRQSAHTCPSTYGTSIRLRCYVSSSTVDHDVAKCYGNAPTADQRLLGHSVSRTPRNATRPFVPSVVPHDEQAARRHEHRDTFLPAPEIHAYSRQQ